ncbi:MAG: alpha/beta fold hydrolase [Pseudomonadota bacterium]
MPDRVSESIAESRFVAAPDGLALHVRCYEPPEADTERLAVLCLPGLTRNEADFEPLALHLSGDAERPRRVFALDSRGRGRSGHDPDWRNYNPAVELGDVIAVMNELSLARAVFVGTSRGGILTMLMAAAQPERIAGALLNDIGPVIEPGGLMRIKGYVGRMRQPADLAEGAEILKGLFAAQFPNLSEADWLAWANRNWKQGPGGLVARYDPALAETLKDLTPDQPIPDLWAQFDLLPQVPLMTIRGGLSDILSATTVDAMRARRPDMESIEIADQGHAPLLAEPEVTRRISEFVRRCDSAV